MREIIYRLLDHPTIFNLVQTIIAPGQEVLLKKQFRYIFENSKGLVLDVGCGPKAATPEPNGKMIGVDISHDYALSYSRQNCQQGIAAKSEQLPFKENSFEESRCFGLLHHLTRDQARQAILELFRCTKIGGRIIIFDSIWPEVPLLRPIPWLSHRFDRGQHMLNDQGLRDLVCFKSCDLWKVHRFTYTYVGHEGLMMILKKEKNND